VLPVEVAPEADLLQLDFVRSENLGGSAERVIFRMVHAAYEVSVKSDFRSEELRIPHGVFVAWVAVQPGPICIRKRLCRGRFLGLGGRGCSCRLVLRLGRSSRRHT